MEQVPHIAMFCQENRPSIPYAFSKYLLPIVVRYLADQNNQVNLLPLLNNTIIILPLLNNTSKIIQKYYKIIKNARQVLKSN